MLSFNDRNENNPYSPRVRGHWQTFLENVKTLVADATQPRCFISYAWPPVGEARDQLQQRLTNLKRDLVTLGATVFLDVTDLASNINAYMDQLDQCNFVLLIGTPKLKARLSERDDNNMKYEYRRIQQKLTLDPNCLLPLMFEGDFATAFPDDIGSILFRDFRLSSQGWAQGRDAYLHNMVDTRPLGLIPVLYNLGEGSPKYGVYRVLCQQLFTALQQLQQTHHEECEQWYQKANTNAANGDYRNAFTDYQQAASRLHAPACYRVAFFYNADDSELPGTRPVPQDPDKALHWFLRGAQFGHVKSMVQVAEKLAYRGREKQHMDDFDSALHWAKLAVKQAEPKDKRQAELTLAKAQRLRAEYHAKAHNNPQAMHEFASHLFHSSGGIAPPKDDDAKRRQFDEALKFAQSARSQGVQEADILIDEIQRTLAQLTSANPSYPSFNP